MRNVFSSVMLLNGRTPASAFAMAGFEAHNLDGGLKAWVAGGHPLEPADGRVA